MMIRLSGTTGSAAYSAVRSWSSSAAAASPIPFAERLPVDPSALTLYTHSPLVPTTWRVTKRINRGENCFTQGLFFRGRQMYESCGMRGASIVRRVSLAGGVFSEMNVAKNPSTDFAEGLCMWPPEAETASGAPAPASASASGTSPLLLQLTWQERAVVVWNADTLAPVERIHFESTVNEGWGITHDGFAQLVMSDGSAFLHFWSPDPAVYRASSKGMTPLRAPVKVVDRIKGGADWLPPTAPRLYGAGWAPQTLIRPTRFGAGFGNGVAVSNLNELEWAHGWVLANIWYDNRVAIINPRSGAVVWYLDFTALVGENAGGDVLNGLAYTMRLDVADAEARGVNDALAKKPWEGRLWVTGKNWKHVYEIELGGFVDANDLAQVGDTVGTGV